MTQTDWSQAFRLVEAHQINAHLWHHFKEHLELLPAEVISIIEKAYQKKIAKDLSQAVLIEQLNEAMHSSGADYIFIKGLAMQRWLHGEHALPRGSADIDLLVFGDENPDGIFRALQTLQLRCVGFDQQLKSFDRWNDEWQRHPELLFIHRMLEGSDIWNAKIDLHRAPTVFYFNTRSGKALMKWLRGQCSEIDFSGGGEDPSVRLPALNPTGYLVYLTINLWKDAQPNLRGMQDIACLLRNHGDRVDLRAARTIARTTGCLKALDLSIEMAQSKTSARIASFLQTPFAKHRGPLGMVRGEVQWLFRPQDYLWVWTYYQARRRAVNRARFL